MDFLNNSGSDDGISERELVEEASIALVREFLNRKGCKKSLAALDDEMPRGPNSICNRADLAQTLHVATLIRKNKNLEIPFRTILEIISWEYIRKFKLWCDGANKSRPATARGNKFSPERGRLGKGQNDGIAASKITNSLTKQKPKKVSSVEEMLSASPEKVIEKKTFRDVVDLKKKQDLLLQDMDDDDDTMDTKCQRWLSGQDKAKFNFDPDNPGMKMEDLQKLSKKKEMAAQKSRKSNRKVGFNMTQSGAPLDAETAASLRKLVFGSSAVRGFNEEWINQAFTFRECLDERTVRLRFGLIQKKGGPCGLLAAVQGYILKHLLFGRVGNEGSEVMQAQPSALNARKEIRTSCLAEAIIEILWRAGSGRRAVLALITNKQSFTPSASYKEDGITEFILTNNCHSLENLHHTVYNSIQQFEKGRGAAILLLYSVILSRGISEVINDMDDPRNTLMGSFSYCTQEMVNLLTVGVAASNTFNDQMTLDEGVILRGVTGRSDIGLLSLFEHYGSCTVGSNLKTPRYPIWIVCSESHFSVLFCLSRHIINDWRSEQLFDLYYYDGLANQDEEMKLTVDTTQKPPPTDPDDLIPPLELCIRTKWPICVVDWNGTEPLL